MSEEIKAAQEEIREENKTVKEKASGTSVYDFVSVL